VCYLFSGSGWERREHAEYDWMSGGHIVYTRSEGKIKELGITVSIKLTMRLPHTVVNGRYFLKKAELLF
jgi:hypothetical protein